MSIVLYTTRFASPPCRAVETVIRILKLDVKNRDVNLAKMEHLESWFAKVNPARKIPVLDDNGYVLTDSHAITPYLFNVYAPKDILEKYYPTDPKERGIVDSRWHFGNGMLFESAKAIIVPLIFFGAKDVPLGKIQVLVNAVDVLEKLLEGKEWLAGNRLTIADIFTIASIDLIEFLIPLKHYKNVSAWAARVRKACPFYEETSREQLDNAAIAFKNTTYDADDRWNQIQNKTKK